MSNLLLQWMITTQNNKVDLVSLAQADLRERAAKCRAEKAVQEVSDTAEAKGEEVRGRIASVMIITVSAPIRHPDSHHPDRHGPLPGRCEQASRPKVPEGVMTEAELALFKAAEKEEEESVPHTPDARSGACHHGDENDGGDDDGGGGGRVKMYKEMAEEKAAKAARQKDMMPKERDLEKEQADRVAEVRRREVQDGDKVGHVLLRLWLVLIVE
jgi:hypothetical protein